MHSTRRPPPLRTLALAAAFALAGCADLTTSTKQVDLNGKSIAIDVKQRIVFSQKRMDGQLVTCPEPSPDALTVIAAGGGISLDAGAGKGVGSASASFAEQGAFVGLRTQSIQTMRDALFSLCVSYASGAVDAQQLSAMQRRFQSTLMGLIAIEQITRPVVAGPALLASGSSAGAGGGAGDAAVDKATEGEDKAIQGRLDAQQAADKAELELRTANDDVREQQKAVTQEKDPEAKKSAQAELDRRVGIAKGKQSDLRDAQRRLQAATVAEGKASQAVRAARSRTSASAAGAGSLGELAGASLATSRAVAKTVEEVVKEVNRSYSKDTCFDLIAGIARDATTYKAYVDSLPAAKGSVGAAPGPINPVVETMRLCTELLKAEITESESKRELELLRFRARQSGLSSGPGMRDEDDAPDADGTAGPEPAASEPKPGAGPKPPKKPAAKKT